MMNFPSESQSQCYVYRFDEQRILMDTACGVVDPRMRTRAEALLLVAAALHGIKTLIHENVI